MHVYHVMRVPGHVEVGSSWDLRSNLDVYLGRTTYAGQVVPDIGAADGFLAFELENRGARVVSVDLPADSLPDLFPGGFEGATDPAFVFTVQDTGAGSASAADVNVLGNALGYVLNQGSTAPLSPDNAKAYAFVLDYAVVTFLGTLTGDEARAFSGAIDTALWSGLFAGFTQIDFGGSPTYNSMLFL
jgi:hypothetical protein